MSKMCISEWGFVRWGYSGVLSWIRIVIVHPGKSSQVI
ncbi:hypothetical protein LSH36_358g02106 [Paralvinella palmiformis]|uniref:Uncharacterized protein n=1 Tax=Paralvinella palmiformis TaxID=53620 RepID=A0AAD9JG86_9ANNE|nr:hypothetical protein LSH36_358g02106 [Paralvinella palmiformis]